MNVAFTIVTCGVVGPAASKLGRFGLVGWLARAPFYVLQLYIAPFILWTRPQTNVQSLGVGFLFVIPLVFLSIAAKCPPLVPITYALSGGLQGLVLGRLARKSERTT